MNIQYTSTEEDYITLKLFASSQTPRVMKQINAQKYIGCGIFLTLALSTGIEFISSHSIFNMVICIFSIAFCIFYSKFNLWIYKKSVSRQLKRIVKNSNSSGIINLSIDVDELKLGDDAGEYTMKTAKILQFTEVEKYFFLQIQKELFLTIPKMRVQDRIAIEGELRYYSSLYSILYIQKLDWNSNIYSKKSKI